MSIVGPVVTTHDPSNTLAPRQCGRCRQLFDGDPTLHAHAIAEWWACPPCRLALLGPERPAAATPTAARP